jgi:hypothetical protein
VAESRLIQDEVIKEIHDFHHALEMWGRGEVSEDAYQLIVNRQAIDLTIVSGDGALIDVDSMNTRLKGMYGESPDLKIWAEIVRTKRLASDHFLAVYYEHNKLRDIQRKRLSSAIFRLNKDLPNHCEWIHLHETWSEQ